MAHIWVYMHDELSSWIEPAKIKSRFYRRALLPTSADGCMVWNGHVNRFGYGVLKLRGRRFMAHRVSYELTVGPIGTGLHLDHICRNRACVRRRAGA